MGNIRDMPGNEIQHVATDHVHGLMAEIYDWLIDQYNLPLHLISFRHNIPYDNDTEGIRKVRMKMRHANRVQSLVYPHFMNAVKCMGQAVFWFGQRLHPTIYAAINDTPFVGLEYQFGKMEDWAGTVGIDNYIFTETATLDDFIEKYHRAHANLVQIKKYLPVRVMGIRKIAQRIMELV